MAFHVRKRSLNHSPIWYRDRFMSEEGTAPLRAMLNADIKLLDCGDDTLTYEELVENYAEHWDRILDGKEGNVSSADIQEVLEREGELGERPVELYSKPPFSTISS